MTTEFIEGKQYDLEMVNLPVVCTWRYLGNQHHTPDFAPLYENRHKEHIIRPNSEGERVEFIGWDPNGDSKPPSGPLSWGYYIMTRRTDGLLQYYPHLKPENRFNIRVGQNLNLGQSIGIMGQSGYTTGIHTHPEMRKNTNSSSYINNQPYINFKNTRMKQIANEVESKFVAPIEMLMGEVEKSGTSYQKSLKDEFNNTDINEAIHILRKLIDSTRK